MKEWQDRAHALLDELLAVTGARIDLDNPKPPVTIAQFMRVQRFLHDFATAPPDDKLYTILTTIYLVAARRGDYSDRTEYAVCWFTEEHDAKACAERMQQASDRLRSRLANKFSPELWDACRVEIGDSDWSPSDHTDYFHHALERGKNA